MIRTPHYQDTLLCPLSPIREVPLTLYMPWLCVSHWYMYSLSHNNLPHSYLESPNYRGSLYILPDHEFFIWSEGPWSARMLCANVKINSFIILWWVDAWFIYTSDPWDGAVWTHQPCTNLYVIAVNFTCYKWMVTAIMYVYLECIPFF